MKIFNKKIDKADVYPWRVMAQGLPDSLRWWVLNPSGVKVDWRFTSAAAFEAATDLKARAELKPSIGIHERRVRITAARPANAHLIGQVLEFTGNAHSGFNIVLKDGSTLCASHFNYTFVKVES